MKSLLSPIQKKELMLAKIKDLAERERLDPIKLAEMFNELVAIHKIFIAKLDEVKHTIDRRVGPPGPQGKPGAKGDNTPRKYVDYFTEAEINQIVGYIESRIRVPEDGKPGETPIKGVHYMTPQDKADFAQLVVKLAAEDENLQSVIISPEKLSQAIEKLAHTKKIKMEHITGLAETIRAFSSQLGRGYLHGGGDTVKAGTNITLTRNADGTTTITAASAGSQVLTATGAINDSNVTFTFTSQPSLLVINGAIYSQTGGAITWSYAAGTVTLSSPVGVGGSLFGIS